MNEFIKAAISDRLRELAEEKESVDYAIIDLQKRLSELTFKQVEMDKTIKETVEFLNAAKDSAKAAKQAKNPKSGSQRDGAPQGNNPGNGETSTPARKAAKVPRKAHQSRTS